MLEDLVDVIDRSWARLQKLSGTDFALACLPFLEKLKRDSRTEFLLDQFRRENLQSREQLIASLEMARKDALAVFEELQERRPEVIPARHDQGIYNCTAEAILGSIAESFSGSNVDALGFAEEAGIDVGFEATLLIVKGLLEKTGLEELKARQNAISDRAGFAKRTRRIYYRTSAGASLARVEHELRGLHPPIIDPDREWLSGFYDRSLSTLHDVIFRNRHLRDDSQDVTAIQGKIDELRADLEQVYEEVRRRLGEEQSLLAVINRYRQRCQWYDSEKLRALARRGVGKPEDRLSETLATYLFDHGLNPLTRPLFGRLLPDIHHTHAKFSFSLEAKQYTRACRKYLLKGMQQVWSMLDHVRGSGFDIHEAFYVIYRRGGPRYDFPPRVPHRDRIVHIIMVDIAPTNKRGSKAPRTLAIRIEDLLPAPTVSRKRRRRKRK